MALKSNLATYFHQKQKNLSLAPKPQTLGIITCLAGLSWFLLVLLAYGADTSLPVVVPIIVSIGMAGISIFLMRYWSNSSNWNDEHRVYLISGAIIANMVAGFVASGISLPIDFIGKLILDIIAVIMLVYLTKRINTHNNDQVRYQSTS